MNRHDEDREEIREKQKVAGLDSDGWKGFFCVGAIAEVIVLFVLFLMNNLSSVIKCLVGGACLLLFLWTGGGCILINLRERWEDERLRRENEENEERERAQRIQMFTGPPPDPYMQAEAALQARMIHAQKLRRLHELRRQVEEEERQAGIFIPTLNAAKPASPAATRRPEPGPMRGQPGDVRLSQEPRKQEAPKPQRADPLEDEMRDLSRRRVEAERQKHLVQARRVVEDAEREADGI